MARKFVVTLVDVFIPAFGSVFPAAPNEDTCKVRLADRLSCTLRSGHLGPHVAHVALERPVRIMGTPREILEMLGDVEDVKPVTRRIPAVRRRFR